MSEFRDPKGHTRRESEGPVLIVLALPIHLKNTSNVREHWSKRARRAAHHRGLARLAVAASNARTLLPCIVTLTRISPRHFDFDGLVCSAKAVRDGIADGLGLSDDNNPSVDFEYAWRKGSGQTVEITIRQRFLMVPGVPPPLLRSAGPNDSPTSRARAR